MEKQNKVVDIHGDIYASLEISPDVHQELEATASELIGITRRSTEQTFTLGEHLERASALLPEGHFNKWLDKRCGFSARNGRLYRAVARNLMPYKKTLVELGVGATVLGKLSSAAPEQIEAAIELAKDKGRLKGSDIDAILKADSVEDDDEVANPYNIGGVEGLKTIVSMKHRDGSRLLVKALQEMSGDTTRALGENRIAKKELQKFIVPNALIAHQYLENLTRLLETEDQRSAVAAAVPLPSGSHWRDFSLLLKKLAHLNDWPVATELRDWLEFEVQPLLTWAISRDAKPVWPGRTLQAVVESNASVGASDNLDDAETNAPNNDDLMDSAKPLKIAVPPLPKAKPIQGLVGSKVRKPILDIASAPPLLHERKRLDTTETPDMVGNVVEAVIKAPEVEQD